MSDSSSSAAAFDDPKSAVAALAGLVVRQFNRGQTPGAIVRQDGELLDEDRIALARLSRLSLCEGREDLGASLHDVLALARQPFADWPLECFRRPEFPYRAMSLIDPELLIPTADCNALFAGTGGMTDGIEEERVYHLLRDDVVRRFSPKEARRAYSLIREWVVRHPLTSRTDITTFLQGELLLACIDVLLKLYEPVPRHLLEDGKVLACAHCKGLLRRRRTGELYCAIRQCAMRHDPAQGAAYDWSEDLVIAVPAILTYWVGPGLDEIRLYDALRAPEREVRIYDDLDACDVFVAPDTGVDAKSYMSAVSLALKLNRDGIGRLARYKRRILAIGEDLLEADPLYIKTLRSFLEGEARLLEVMPVGRVIEELSRA